jgi:hypothetical protein
VVISYAATTDQGMLAHAGAVVLFQSIGEITTLLEAAGNS